MCTPHPDTILELVSRYLTEHSRARSMCMYIRVNIRALAQALNTSLSINRPVSGHSGRSQRKRAGTSCPLLAEEDPHAERPGRLLSNPSFPRPPTPRPPESARRPSGNRRNVPRCGGHCLSPFRSPARPASVPATGLSYPADALHRRSLATADTKLLDEY